MSIINIVVDIMTVSENPTFELPLHLHDHRRFKVICKLTGKTKSICHDSGGW